MPQTLTRPLVVLLLLLLAGAHWSVLQSVAWVNMTVQFSHQSSFSEALTKTFNGKNPCRLCKFVSQGKQSEQDNNQQITLQRLDMVGTETLSLVSKLAPAPNHLTAYRGADSHRPHSPPTPPPRQA